MPASTASPEEFQAWMAGLSMTTMLAATVVHWLGTAAGAATGMLVAARSVVDALGYIPAAYTVGRLLRR